MDIRVGDQIKYLNDVGGGKVVAIHNNKMAVILQDDGFEVPVLLNECLKVESHMPANKPIMQKEVIQPVEKYNYTEINSPEGDQINLILAFVPNDPNSLDYADLELYLVNDSNYFCQYACGTLKMNGALLIDNNIVEPNTKVLVDSFEKRSLLENKAIWFQGNLFKIGKPFQKKDQVEFEITLNAEKFEPNRFKKNAFFKEQANLYLMIENDFYKGLKQLTDREIEAVKLQKDSPGRAAVKVEPPKNNTIEIDLHINALVDTLTGLSNADILNHQMSKFRETLEENKTNKGLKIVFIHGVGNGTLKTELRKELDRKKINYQDASFREYGYGATMVIL